MKKTINCIEQYFPLVLFITRDKVALLFEDPKVFNSHESFCSQMLRRTVFITLSERKVNFKEEFLHMPVPC